MPSRTLRSVAALCAAFALAAIPSLAHPQALSLSLALAMPAARVPALVVVPDVRGQTLSGAAVRVANVGLVPRHAASSPGDLDTSPVRRQWPRAGQRVPQGTVVALELATSAATPARAPVARPAAVMARGSATSLAHTSVSASFEARGGAGGPSAAASWWIAAAVCAPLLAITLRVKPARRAAPAPLPESVAHPASGAAPAAAALGRLRRAVWVKRVRGVPRVALASAGSITATEDA